MIDFLAQQVSRVKGWWIDIREGLFLLIGFYIALIIFSIVMAGLFTLLGNLGGGTESCEGLYRGC